MGDKSTTRSGDVSVGVEGARGGGDVKGWEVKILRCGYGA